MHWPELYDADGNLKPVSEWPKSQTEAALQLLGLKRQALKDILEYLRHAGVYWSPAPPPPLGNTLNSSVTVVPVERLTDEELEFYRVLAEKGRAIPIIDVSKPDSPRPAMSPDESHKVGGQRMSSNAKPVNVTIEDPPL
ncbi:MAG TPA: hypothetical protein VGY48_24395 [Vicinamibacterales bacterium]|jgi:hypothetical protein|nr:hypothetical protein [Vicinamibacterales bacterium]